MTRYLAKSAMALLILISAACTGNSVLGQEQFRLYVPNSNVESKAVLTGQSLSITDSRGRATVYDRDVRLDTPDGRYLGFYSRAAKQGVRWPINGGGRMQIGAVTAQGIRFRSSQMLIQSIGPAPTVRTARRIATDSYLKLTTKDCEAVGLCLDVDRNGRPVMGRSSAQVSQQWTLTPVGQGLYRIQSERAGKAWSLSCEDRTRDVRLAITDGDVHQLWRVSPLPNAPGYYSISSAARAHAGRSLSASRRFPPELAATSPVPSQYWRIEKLKALKPVFGGRRFVSRKLTPNSPLPAARVELANSHTKELWVLLTDLRDPTAVRRLKIPPNSSQTVLIDRDPGASFIEIYDVILPNGVIRREQLSTIVPPQSFYDVSVYELILQSIAIDRTAKGGGRVEDVNYSPKSLGWLVLPPGDALQNARMDVYKAAKELENPGQVRRIDLKKWRPGLEKKDPLEAILDGLKSKAARKAAEKAKRKGREF